jgi:hypothetical protein
MDERNLDKVLFCLIFGFFESYDFAISLMISAGVKLELRIRAYIDRSSVQLHPFICFWFLVVIS